MLRFYQFGYTARDVECTVTLNGFPLLETQVEDSPSGGQPVNMLLVGPGNLLRAEVRAKGSEPALQMDIEVADEGRIVRIPPRGGVELPEGVPPLVLEQRFDADIAPFRVLLDEVRETDAAAMRAFAIALRDAVQAGDAPILNTMCRPKAQVYSRMYGEPADVILGHLLQGLEQFAQADLSFAESEVEARPWCDGRIWELRRKGRKTLLEDKIDDGMMHMPVFAAMTGDGPAMVM
jgi:hypothetical protein